MAAAGESETPEFKSATGVRREAARTVCAMLNQNGGHVLFGVLPDGKVVRQHVSERTIEQLSAEFATIDPPAFPEIERIRVREALEVTMAISANRGQAGPLCTAGARIGGLATRRLKCMRSNTSKCSSSACTANAGGRTSPRTNCRSTIRTQTKSGPPRRRPFAVAVLRIPGRATPTTCFAASGCSRMGSCGVRQSSCQATRKASGSICLSACFAYGIDRTEFLDNRQFQGNAFSLLRNAGRFLRDNLLS